MMRIQEDLILLCFPLSHFTDVAFFFLNKLKVCDSSVLSDDGYQFFLATWQSSLFLMNVCSVFLDIDRLQYSVHIHFYMHWETEKKNSCDLLYCNIHFVVMVWKQTNSIPEVCL